MGKATQTIKGLNEPQGVLFIHELNKIFVTNGGNGVCNVLDSQSLNPIKAIKF